MKRYIYLLGILVILSACAGMEVEPETQPRRGIGHGTYKGGPANTQYLVGGASPRWKMRTIINDLTRVYESEDFAISAVPYTEALLETSLRENVTPESRSSEKTNRSPYYKDQSCFIVEVATHEEETARLNKWEGRLQDATGKVYPAVFQGGSFLRDLPVATQKYFPKYEWENSTLACAEKIDFGKSFKLSVRPPGDDDSSPPPIIFLWNER